MYRVVKIHETSRFLCNVYATLIQSTLAFFEEFNYAMPDANSELFCLTELIAMLWAFRKISDSEYPHRSEQCYAYWQWRSSIPTCRSKISELEDSLEKGKKSNLSLRKTSNLLDKEEITTKMYIIVKRTSYTTYFINIQYLLVNTKKFKTLLKHKYS